MIKVLLVDDEPFIRQGLKLLVNWEEFGYEVVAEADNGLEALHILNKMSVDLVIVDLKMPGMTGLELIKKIGERKNTGTRFVILTGFADFDYVRQALKLHVEDYLLKPVQKIELKMLLKKLSVYYQHKEIVQECTSEKSIAEKMSKYTKEHYMENLSLTSMGEMFYMNKIYLGQLFKNKYKISYKEYLNQIRIKKATEYLDNTFLKVYDIAEKVGYQNVDYFISRFTKVKGITPHQYRIKQRGEDYH